MEVVVEAAHVRVPEGGAVQEGGRAAVQPLEAALVVAGVRAGARERGAPGRGRRGGALARAVVLDHQVLDAVHGRVEGQVPAAGARGAPCAERVGAERPAEAARARPAHGSRRAPASQAQGGRHVLGVAAEDLALGVGMSTEEQQESESA